MKQKTINLYQFNELTPDQQEKCLDKHRFINDDVFELYVNDEICLLSIFEAGFNNPKVFYSLSYSQGDGACFDCSDFDINLLLKEWQHPHKKWIINIIKNFCECSIKPYGFSNLYNHERTRIFEIDFSSLNANYTHIEHFIMVAEQHIEELRLNLCVDLKNRLYDQLEWFRDDEQVKETLIANEYYFNAETLEIEE